jgi:predicted deacylase
MLQLSENLRTVIDQDGAVLLDVRQGKLVRCNRTGAAILELLSHQYNEEQITAEFCRRYELSLASAETDVRAFLTSLQQQGLLRHEIAGEPEE